MTPDRVSPAYEAELERLYVAISAVIVPHRAGCPDCGGDDRCNPLGDAIASLIGAAFPEDQAERWLAACPDAWDWGETAMGYESVRAYVAATFQQDAWDRLLPDAALVPLHPSQTLDLSYGD